MKNIVFYVSDHGFGHAARNIQIIKTMIKLEPEVRVHVKTSGPQLQFMKDHIGPSGQVLYYEEAMDVGLILKEGTLLVDEAALKTAVEEYVDSWDEKIEKEKVFLRETEAGLIVSDICPWAIAAADEAGVKSILISNFTWVEIYKEYLPEELWDAYLGCYEIASKVMIYDLNMPELQTYNPEFEMISLVCRNFDFEEVERIKAEYKEPIVYVSLGMSAELKEEVDVSHLPYHFIVTPGLKVKGENVTYLPADTKNTQNYIAASKFVISKAGWSTVSEILLSGRRCALLKRDTVAEDRNTISLLKDREQCIEIGTKDLLHMEEVMERLEAFRFSYDHEYHNDDYDIVKKLLFAYPEKRRRRR